VLFGSIRYDQTNLYGQSSKYRDQPTWSAGGKWILSKEEFFKSDIINMLAFKISYGLNGNIEKNTSPYLIARASRDVTSGLKTQGVSNPANPDLGWEKSYTFNTGFNLDMLNNRLSISAEYYNKETKDALGDEVLDPTSGWNKIRKNTASILNRGIDLQIDATPISNSNFKWNSSFNISYNINKVTKLNSGNPTIASITNGNALLNEPLDYIFGYKYAGLNNEGNPMIFNSKGEKLLYTSISGFNTEDLDLLGRRTPPVFGGFLNTFDYKGFSLDMLFNFKFGHLFRMPSLENVVTSRGNADLANRWIKAGDENTTWVPKYDPIAFSNKMAVVNASDTRTEKGDIIRLRSFGIGYNFKQLLRKEEISGLSLKFSVENLFKYVSNSQGLDSDNVFYNLFGGSGKYLGDIPTYYTISILLTL
jgi:hypothetical protein